MNPIAAQQVALNNALVAPENRVQIGKCNMRIDPIKTLKESTYQVVLDALALSSLYQAFLITAEVPEIYMHQFWHTITKIKDSSSYKFKLDKKRITIDVQVFRDILQICPRLPNQEFVVPPSSDEDIVSFIKELGYTGDIDFVSKVYTDHMHQPWRTFAVVINRCLFGKTTGAATPKKARKLKKPASPPKKKTIVTVEEPVEKPTKKPATRRQSAGGSSEGADLELEVPDEPKGKSIDTNEGTGLKPGVPDVSKNDSSKSEYESWGDSDDDNDDDNQQKEDEFVHTPEDYVPTDEENVDDEEYDQINREMYDDVNVRLRNAEREGKGKDDEEMTDVGHIDTEQENFNQEVAGDQVKDDAQAIITAALATQKTEVPLQSSSISSDYATKFLNFDNIPSGDTEIISMMDVKFKHEDPSIQTTPLLTIPVTVIPETSSALTSTIPLTILPFIPLQQQSTPILTPTTTEATISTTFAPNSTALSAIYQRLSDMENEVKTLKNVDHGLAIRATVKSEVPTIVKEYLGTSLVDALHKALQRHTAELVKEHSVPADVTDVLQQQQKPQKTNVDHKALYHALMDSILEDEDAMDKGVANKLKKRKSDDVDRDEGQPAGPDQEETVFETGDTQVPQNLGEDTGNTDEPPIVNVDPKDWFKKPERPPTLDPEWNECKKVKDKPTQKWLSNFDKTEKPSKTFDDLMSTLTDFNAFENIEECYKALTHQLDGNNPKGDRYPFDLSKPLPLVKSGIRQIVPVDYFFNNDLAYLQGGSTGRTYTTSLTKTKDAKYDMKGIKDMVPNLWSPIKVAYNNHALLVINVKFILWYGYGHLEEIEVCRSDQQLYKFIEGDFYRLHLNGIKDILILVVPNRLFKLKGEDIMHLAAALRMFTRSIVIQIRVEDLQLGVESYQKKLNISKPRTCDEDLSRRTPYTTLSDPQGVIYEDKLNKKRLMRSDELYKFSDGTL
ncbi:hypothetical protein Tco_1044571 [Tanacetum coccineum]|uniref:Uncharacterized protein n=1 Tax=Tanacetum coccineum TaxID=301880 RepID=A0ABQ5GRJ7_9ASTR